jgi:hypothetical protein
MRTSRFLMAALTVGLLSSTVALAAAPTADQVSVPAGTRSGHLHGKFKALFQSQEEFMMYRLQMHDAMRDMPRDQRKAYKKSQIQKIRGMTDQEKASWRKDLDAKWAALSPDRQQRIEGKLQRREARHAERQQRRHGGQDQGQYQDQNMAQPQQ